MTKVIMKEKKNRIEFGCLNVGDCFFDSEGAFCIKVNSATCLAAKSDLVSWEECGCCNSFEEVYPVDVEIHIVN